MDTNELVIWINKLISYHNIKAFYNCVLWENLRLDILDEQHHECQMCKADSGLYSEAVTVHHVKFVRDYPELALTKSNLLCVCKECHYKIHHPYEVKVQINEEKW
ncbi:HNH endonuclease [Clostridium tagluense]|uniref:HNH endonuclease n=1 Tax=Clostridium tagluense TaxID=360422 RepID=UPI001CF1698E|nr:HNH endonuclease signature motif containing protein [Clostridium tagluense]MCB2311618.1 HNH endonuclease [Clostridium tagluense]MCB2316342.1 HNH endonuclease [Clostridium tagluense]MCB2321274.1 HNH endonuclease [Clostridium tagluense]MCB2326211.1 HNH endonuclease [Clostridium tagluense]MCB2331010.1 HNH endonuclease [Clostridium tagluense]